MTQSGRLAPRTINFKDFVIRIVFVKKPEAYNGKIKMNSLILGSEIYPYFIKDKNA